MSANTSTASRELSISRLLNAPRELVWEVWTKPEHIKNWWGPSGFTNTIFQMEVMPGGVWDFIMHGPDGQDYKNKSIYKEVVPYEKLVYDHVTGPAFQFTVTFTAQGKKTLVSIQMLFATAEQKDRVVKEFSADKGMVQNVDRLEHYLEKNQAVVVEKILQAPVALVWQAITDKDQMKRWYFDIPMFKPEVGCEFQFSGLNKTGDVTYLHLCRVIEVVPLQKLTYSWRYEGFEGDSFVCFELFDEGEQTRLVLTHTALESFPASNPDLAKENFVGGWNFIIGQSLPGFLSLATG